MTDRDDLRPLVAGGFPLITIESCEEPRVIEMLSSLARWTLSDGLSTVSGADFFRADQ